MTLPALWTERLLLRGRVLHKLGMRREGTLREHVWHGDRFEDLECCAALEDEWRGR